SLARYVAATRPGSRQRAVEVSAEVAQLVRQELPLPRGTTVPVQVADAREAVGRMRADSADVVVLDVFAGARTPAHLTSTELLYDVARLLVAGGVFAANVADGPPLRYARSQVAGATEVFPHVAVAADPGVWRGRRFGNLVLVGSDQPLPVAALARRCAGDPLPARLTAGADLHRFVAGAPTITDATAQDSPAPPPELFRR
ncbi:MAG: hypothetical protein QOE40_540, partial [Actinomycetota bacterium]|nr:hypothetical protein [Actinomycetota bacterium]